MMNAGFEFNEGERTSSSFFYDYCDKLPATSILVGVQYLFG